MSGTFSYREAIEAGCFLQLPLFGTDELNRAVAARGLADFPISLNWEPLDREGLLPPVAYALQTPVPPMLHLQALEEEVLILRDERGYREWSEEVRPLYAHWQLLSLADLHEALSGRSPLVMLAGETKQLSDHLAGRAEALKDPEYPSSVVVDHRHWELLLTRTQSLFMPIVRGSYKLEPVIDRYGEKTGLDTEEWVRRERRDLDYAAAAEECGVSADDIRKHHEALMMKVGRLDPLVKWRDLVDQVERRRIEQLTGDARRAQDLYDAAEVLRLWHRNLTGEGNLAEEWDESTHFGPSRREVNKALYGFERLRGNRAALPGILDGFGLYPWRVMLVTEGEGDVDMLGEIIRAHTGATLEELGIVPHVMGAPRKKGNQPIQELLGALWRFPNYFFLAFDNEGTAAAWVKQLERYQPGHPPFEGFSLLEPEPAATSDERPAEGWSGTSYFPKRRPGAEVWEEDIEADNFSPAELCEVICGLADEDERVEGFSLNLDELAEARQWSNKAVAEVAKNLAEDKGLRFPKPDLDKALGRYAVAHPLDAAGNTRRVLIVAKHLYRLTVANRQMRGRLRESEREAAAESDRETEGRST